MTTPEINRNDVVQQYGLFRQYINGTLRYSENSGLHVASVTAESRPESVSHPIDKNGWRAPTAWYHRSVKTHQPAAGRAVQVIGYSRNEYSNGYGVVALPTSASSALNGNVENRAIIQALTSLKRQDFNTGVFLAEASEGIELLASVATRIRKGVSGFQKKFPRDWKKVKRYQVGPKVDPKTGLTKDPVSDKIPSGWLELQYGWIPMMSDVAGFCKAANTLAQNTEPRIAVSGYAYDQDDIIIRANNSAAPDYCNVRRRVVAKCKVSLWFTPENQDDILKTRIGLTNPAEIVWERVPFSFVADWFLPVGPWLGVLDATNGWRFKTGIRSRKVTCVDSVHSFTRVGGPIPFQEFNIRPALLDIAEFSRTVYASSPVPGLYIKSPLSTKHAANAVALLAEIFRR